jgi:hypothetical protein
MALLSSGDYPAIRALIDTALTSGELADAAIGYDQVIGYADRLVKAYVPLAESLTGDNLLRAKLAARLIAASELAKSAPQITDVKIGPYTEGRQDVDWRRLSRELRLRADKEIQALL